MTSASNPPLVATCHCGQIQITVPSVPDRVNECLCTVCYKYGVLWSYYQRGAVVIKTDGDANGDANDTNANAEDPTMQCYFRFDCGLNGGISFNHCTRCGCMTHWIGHSTQRTTPESIMGINARMFPREAIIDVRRTTSDGPPVRK